MIRINAHSFSTLIAISIVLSGCGRKSPDEHLIEAEDAVRDANWGAAAKSYKKAAAETKDSPYVYLNMAAAYLRNGDTLNARNAVDAALALAPENAEATELKADIAVKSGDFIKAHEILEKAVKTAATPTDKARMLNSLATAEFELHREDLAVLNVQLALLADPQYAPAHFNRARILSDYCLMYNEAIASFEKFVSWSDDEAQKAKAGDAIERLRPFAEKQSSDATLDSKFNELKTAYVARRYEDAISIAVRSIIPVWPESPSTYMIASYSWASQKCYYEARAYGQAYVEIVGKASPSVDTSAFQKWMGQIPETSFPAGR